MSTINVISIAPDARDWLTTSREARILHVFDQACNLINERREIVSVVTPEIGNGPFNLVVDVDVRFTKLLDAQTSVSIRVDGLDLGDLILSTGNATIWCPRPDWEKLYSEKEKIRKQLESLSIAVTQPQLPDTLISDFGSALAAADISTAVKITSQLAGLGIGLTPAGDDFIFGALLGAWIVHPTRVAAVLANKIVNTAMPLTTSLSAAWLRSAGKAETGILWHDFFDSLVSTDPNRIQFVTDRIISVGETSGADALTGFIAVLRR
jgi:hypothetical protein